MSFWTGVKVVIAALLAVADIGLLVAAEMVFTGHAGFTADGGATFVPVPGGSVLAWLVPAISVVILWYGMFGPGFFGTGKKTR